MAVVYKALDVALPYQFPWMRPITTATRKYDCRPATACMANQVMMFIYQLTGLVSLYMMRQLMSVLPEQVKYSRDCLIHDPIDVINNRLNATLALPLQPWMAPKSVMNKMCIRLWRQRMGIYYDKGGWITHNLQWGRDWGRWKMVQIVAYIGRRQTESKAA